MVRNMVKKPDNEKINLYVSGTKAREDLLRKPEKIKKETIDIPLIIEGKQLKTNEMSEVHCPHDHARVLARVHLTDRLR